MKKTLKKRNDEKKDEKMNELKVSKKKHEIVSSQLDLWQWTDWLFLFQLFNLPLGWNV